MSTTSFPSFDPSGGPLPPLFSFMSAESSSSFDLDAYFERIAYTGNPRANAETLRDLHEAHATHIPFENLDVLLGNPPRLDLESLQAKLVHGRRGGYCFEQNALFAAALENLGFAVTRLAARMRVASGRIFPRTHMMLLVHADSQPWVADVGFGGCGLLEPIPLIPDRDFPQGAWNFRLTREEHTWVLHCPRSPRGPDQYVFTLEPQLPVDYVPPNHYCATHPDSRFVQVLTAQIAARDIRLVLVNRELHTLRANGATHETIESEEALLQVLAARFGLHMPAGTRFRPTMDPAKSG